MASTFVRSGIFRGDLVLSIYEGTHSHIRLIDPDTVFSTVDLVLTDMGVQGSQLNNWVVAGQNDAGAIIAGQAVASISPPRTSELTIIAIPAQGDGVSYHVEADTYSGVNYARFDGDSILWTDFEYVTGSEARAPVRSAYTLPRSKSVGIQSLRTRLFTTQGVEGANGPQGASFYLGESLLAYSNGNELHARTYDGTLDLIIETGVESILENNRNDYFTGWLR
jgi:hypothetical protein